MDGYLNLFPVYSRVVIVSCGNPKSVLLLLHAKYYAICVVPYKRFPICFHSFLPKIFIPRTWQDNRNKEWIAKKNQVYVLVTSQNRFTHYKCQKIPIKLIFKQYPVVTSLECLFSNMPKIFMARTWLICPNWSFLCWKWSNITCYWLLLHINICN